MENKSITKGICSLCNNESDDGIIIKNINICCRCEKEIVHLDINDIKRYDLYIDKIKKIIL